MLNFETEKKWVGFCSYREYWGNKKNKDGSDLKDLVLQKPAQEWDGFETIIGEPIFVGETKFLKMLKYGKMALVRNPKAIFSRKWNNIY